MKRRAEGGESEYIEGSAAACLEAGLPQSMMAMLVRAGLPSRIAARRIIEETKPAFTTRSEMSAWLSSNEIVMLSSEKNWPTPETAAIWARFRLDVLAAPVQRWTEQEWKLEATLPAWAPVNQPARIDVEPSGRVAVTSPDYQEIAGIKQKLSQTDPSLLRVDFNSNRNGATIKREGRGAADWLTPQI
jgi:hypothetical protein